jgi:hypothetical protein
MLARLNNEERVRYNGLWDTRRREVARLCTQVLETWHSTMSRNPEGQ